MNNIPAIFLYSEGFP